LALKQLESLDEKVRALFEVKEIQADLAETGDPQIPDVRNTDDQFS
jgi:hypothetical protein